MARPQEWLQIHVCTLWCLLCAHLCVPMYLYVVEYFFSAQEPPLRIQVRSGHVSALRPRTRADSVYTATLTSRAHIACSHPYAHNDRGHQVPSQVSRLVSRFLPIDWDLHPWNWNRGAGSGGDALRKLIQMSPHSHPAQINLGSLSTSHLAR